MENELPKKKINGLTFYPVPKFDAPTCAFGADESCYFDRRNLPYVPEKYKDAAMNLFYKGGKLPELAPQVDPAEAAAAMRAWLSSWAPAHEAKEATAGYALWLWSTPEALD